MVQSAEVGEPAIERVSPSGSLAPERGLIVIGVLYAVSTLIPVATGARLICGTFIST